MPIFILIITVYVAIHLTMNNAVYNAIRNQKMQYQI